MNKGHEEIYNHFNFSFLAFKVFDMFRDFAIGLPLICNVFWVWSVQGFGNIWSFMAFVWSGWALIVENFIVFIGPWKFSGGVSDIMIAQLFTIVWVLYGINRFYSCTAILMRCFGIRTSLYFIEISFINLVGYLHVFMFLVQVVDAYKIIIGAIIYTFCSGIEWVLPDKPKKRVIINELSAFLY